VTKREIEKKCKRKYIIRKKKNIYNSKKGQYKEEEEVKK